MAKQARIPVALAAIHNFIVTYDPHENTPFDESECNHPHPHLQVLAAGPAGRAERERANAKRDQIAADMWKQYQEELRARAEG